LKRQYRDQIDACRLELDAIRQSHDSNDTSCFLEIQKKLKILTSQDESYWRQRENFLWLNDGDIN